jgi:inhibitor of cysteine peptidase
MVASAEQIGDARWMSQVRAVTRPIVQARRRVRGLSWLIALCALLGGCGMSTAGRPTMDTITLRKHDSGRRLMAPPNTQVVVQLPENPTTGYRWSVDQLDEAILAPGDSTYRADSDGAIGGGGVHTFSFTARQPGATQLRLKLWREWEGDASVTDRFEAAIQVQ